MIEGRYRAVKSGKNIHELICSDAAMPQIVRRNPNNGQPGLTFAVYVLEIP